MVRTVKRRIEQLLNGRFTYEAPELVTSEETINLRLFEGETHKGILYIGTKDGHTLRGMVLTDNERIVPAASRFFGSTNQIVYSIDTKGLACGDTITGKIVILSSAAQKQVPVTVTIVCKEVSSSIGAIRTLEDFTRLAKDNQREAFRLFTGDGFLKVLGEKRGAYAALYKGLSHNPVTYQHMEEFLIGAGEKEPVRIAFDREPSGRYNLNGSQKDTLRLIRSGWGRLQLEVETAGNFLQAEKRVISDDDFIGSTYALGFVLDAGRLVNGRNFGKIIIKSAHQRLEYIVEAQLEGRKVPEKLRLCRHLVARIAANDLNMRLHRMDYRSWFEQTKADLLELKNADGMNPMLTLYEAYVYLAQDDITGAMETLWSYRQQGRGTETPEEQGFYLYLAGRVNLLPPGQRNILPKLRESFLHRPDSYYLLTALVDTDESILSVPAQYMQTMEHAFTQGLNSPFLYLDAYRLLKKQEDLLRKLTPFMIQVVTFAQRAGILNSSILHRVAFLSDNIKEFGALLYGILEKGYETYRTKDVLEALCKYILRTQPAKRKYFRWYSLAVREEIRITGLYESYIETMQETAHEELPLVIRMYFTYNRSLSARKRAIVYANVIKSRQEEKVIYSKYKPEIERFAAAELNLEAIDDNFAVIYKDCYAQVRTKEQAACLTRVLFKHKVCIRHPRIKSVIVCHDAFATEREYLVRDGVAYVDIYCEDAKVLFEDDRRRRYAATVDYSIEALFADPGMAVSCADFHVNDPGLLLFYCKSLPEQMRVNGKSLTNYMLAADSGAFTSSYRSAIREKLLAYFDAHPKNRQFAEFMKGLDIDGFARANKAGTVHALLLGNQSGKALALVDAYGPEGVDPLVLLKLTSESIANGQYEPKEKLIGLAAFVFGQGKYDDVILKYLEKYFCGTLEEMCDIREKARGFALDSYDVDERILKVAMFVRGLPKPGAKILKSYMDGGGSRTLIKAYLTYICTVSFVGEVEVEKSYFTILEDFPGRDKEMDVVCHLALLKYYTTLPKLSEIQEARAAAILRACNCRNLRFAFFKELPSPLTEMYQVEDKVFVEGRFPAGSRVVLHYALCKCGERLGTFKAEPVKEQYRGIFGREFLLFFGEQLTYYFTVMEDGRPVSTPRKELTLGTVPDAGRSKYQLLNRLLSERALGNTEGEKKTLTTYLCQDALVHAAFHIME